MPRFFFHLTKDIDVIDTLGEPHATLNDAMIYADRVAEELGRNRMLSDFKGQFICVTDADGKEVYRSPLFNRNPR